MKMKPSEPFYSVMWDALISYILYENGIPKDQHPAFIRKHKEKMLKALTEVTSDEVSFDNLKKLVPQLEFDHDMKELLDEK